MHAICTSQEQEIDDEMELLVLASDGLWDVVPNEVKHSLCWSDGITCWGSLRCIPTMEVGGWEGLHVKEG